MIDTSSYATAINETSEWSSINRLWDSRPPIMSLTQEDMKKGNSILKAMGLPENAWFICFHCREGGYSPNDEQFHSFRNAKIDTFILSMKSITEEGGWSIRMGDPTMAKLPKLLNVIDYAHSEYKSDFMDVFLSARCRFFIGTASGLCSLTSVFGIPRALTNLAPLSMSIPPMINDLGICKLYWSENEKRILTFKEIFANSSANYRITEMFVSDKISLIDNTADEIQELTLEMLSFTDLEESVLHLNQDEEILQSKFKKLMKPGHFTYGSRGSVGRSFLNKYQYLLD
jgi:putative glycosyltransferase (TIGR04372 family)